MKIHLKNFIKPALFVFLVLLFPLISMQFSTEVNWTLSDFGIAAILLFLVSSGVMFSLKLIRSRPKKWLFVMGILLIFFLIWAELAVGLFGNPFAGN